jgi:hypothetical protein
MPRITEQTRERNETAIRAAMDRLLRGEIPPGRRCDLKTLAAEAGVTRTGFYPKGDRPGPYQHLADEFERRLAALREAGQIPDPREAQIARLKEQIGQLHARLHAQGAEVEELKAFKQLAVSRLAAQHDEILLPRRIDGVHGTASRPSPSGMPTEYI